MMKRKQAVITVAWFVVIVPVTAFILSSFLEGNWAAIGSGVFSAVSAVVLIRVMELEKLKDERYKSIMVISARNGFLFLLLAMPWLGVFLAFEIIMIESAAQVVSLYTLLYFIALGVSGGSALYYYRR